MDDIQEPFLDPVDRQIGECWMICVVGSSLGNIATKSESKLHFHVNDSTPVTGDPVRGLNQSSSFRVYEHDTEDPIPNECKFQSVVRLNNISCREKYQF